MEDTTRVLKNKDTDKVFQALDLLLHNIIMTPSSLNLITGVDKAITDACILQYVQQGKLRPMYRVRDTEAWSETIPTMERDLGNIFVAFKKTDVLK